MPEPPLTLVPRPIRVLLQAAPLETWFAASDAEKEERFFPRFRAVLARFEEVGGRVVASFCDDLLVVGPPPSGPAWSLLFEVDDLETAARLIHAVRETVDGERLDRWVRCEARIGRPFWAREEHPQVQRVEVHALAVDAGERVLVCRDDASGRWSLPGEAVRHGEAPEEALRRVLATAGVGAAGGSLVHAASDTQPAPDGHELRHTVRLVYRVAVEAAEPGAGLGWRRRSELDALELAPFAAAALGIDG
jgi:ADP-ribose pyrophosphatase YjhB (NUDIX family)